MMWEVRVAAYTFGTQRAASRLMQEPAVVAVNKRPPASGPEWAVAVRVASENEVRLLARRMGWSPLAVRRISEESVNWS